MSGCVHLSTIGWQFSKRSTLTWAGYLVCGVLEIRVQPAQHVKQELAWIEAATTSMLMSHDTNNKTPCIVCKDPFEGPSGLTAQLAWATIFLG